MTKNSEPIVTNEVAGSDFRKSELYRIDPPVNKCTYKRPWFLLFIKSLDLSTNGSWKAIADSQKELSDEPKQRKREGALVLLIIFERDQS